MSKTVALFVDGDNVSHAHAEYILGPARKTGRPGLMRVYGDAGRIGEWAERPEFRFVHAGSGKNATDILLALDAQEAALSGRYTDITIASSDGDFRHLALRLRELGMQVHGIGEAKTPEGFRRACTTFSQLGPVNAPIKCFGAKASLDRQIAKVLDENGDPGQSIQLTVLSQRMKQRFGTMISAQSEKTWRGYLSARPELYELDPRGPAARVRLKRRARAA